MISKTSTLSSDYIVQQIGTELAGLFQRQIELTRREALVGLTPGECEEYEKIAVQIRESYLELARARSNP